MYGVTFVVDKTRYAWEFVIKKKKKVNVFGKNGELLLRKPLLMLPICKTEVQPNQSEV